MKVEEMVSYIDKNIEHTVTENDFDKIAEVLEEKMNKKKKALV